MTFHPLAKKNLKELLLETEGERGGLKRALGPLNLVTLGIGAIIGTGIFVLTGTVAANEAGPALVLSFIISAIGCVFAGLCYAEFAALIPISGSSYSYAYTTLGEIVAWVIGWALILEYAFGAATVAVGWSGYVVSLIQALGINIPPSISNAPGTQMVLYHGHWQPLMSLPATAHGLASLPHAVSHFDLLAVIGIAIMTSILVKGIRESAGVNTVIVIVKVSVLLIFLGIGIVFLTAHPSLAAANWHPFIPPNKGHYGEFGWSGVLRGAGIIFFSYIGFDAVSTAAQEAKRPQRDMPIGILGSLVICTILYILVSLVLTGLVSYTRLNVADPIVLGVNATGVHWGAVLVEIGAIGGLSSTMLVMLLGQSRIFFTMAHDGLLWGWAGKVHPKLRTPYISTIVIGICAALLAAFFPITTLGELVSIGTLFAFTIVCAGVWILRRRQPDLPRPFRTPWVPFVPIMGILISLLLMFSLHLLTWEVFLIWLALGLVIYMLFSRKNSKVQRLAANAPQPEGVKPRV